MELYFCNTKITLEILKNQQSCDILTSSLSLHHTRKIQCCEFHFCSAQPVVQNFPIILYIVLLQSIVHMKYFYGSYGGIFSVMHAL